MKPRMHWGVGIALVYLVFAGSTVGFVAFAMRQQVDLVSADYYPQSLAYDARMASAARADALGNAFSAELETKTAALVVQWPAAMRVEEGLITWYRAADASADRREIVRPDHEGRQRVETGGLARGLWLVRLQWTAGGRSYFAERRVTLP